MRHPTAQLDRLVARPDVGPRGLKRAAIKVAAEQQAVAPEMRPLDQHGAGAAQRIEHDIVVARRRRAIPSRRRPRAAATGAMRGLVLAMAHPLVAEPERQDEFVREHRGPELDFCIVAGQAQSMVAALADSAFDRALKSMRRNS